MRPVPAIDLFRLREIADRDWDVLGATHRKAIGTDRYDGYLATGAMMLWNGESLAIVGDYFVGVSVEFLGIDTGAGIRERAQLFAGAIASYLDGLAASPRSLAMSA